MAIKRRKFDKNALVIELVEHENKYLFEVLSTSHKLVIPPTVKSTAYSHERRCGAKHEYKWVNLTVQIALYRSKKYSKIRI